MSLGNRLLVPAALLGFAAAIRLAAQAPARPPSTSASTTRTAADPFAHATLAEGYVGSDACQRCHDAPFDQWTKSLHVRMTKPIDQALVVGDFTPGTSFSSHGRTYRIDTKDARRYITVQEGEDEPTRYEVQYTLGAKRFQGYLTTLAGGRIYVLPAMWSVEQRRWVDWREITPVPDGVHGLKQIWNVACFNCHATNLVQGYDALRRAYDTTWTELGVACEACHGPGRAHIALADGWATNPASKPAYDASASNHDLSRILKIFSPRTAPARAVYDTCAYCHGNKQNRFVGFVPGDRYEDFAVPFLVSEPMPPNDRQGEFWPDGRPSRFNRSQALAMSGCFVKGQIACTNCHSAHGTRNPNALKVDVTKGANGDLLCTQCHKALTLPAVGPSAPVRDASLGASERSAVEQHTHHRAASEGSRCVNCHMAPVNWRLLLRKRDHTFAPPVPELTAKYGEPNACTSCHEDRTPEWAATTMDAWYGNAATRATVVARSDAFYLAGAGDTAALPALYPLALDRRLSFVLRASAVEFIGRLVTDNRAGSSGLSATGARGGQSQTSFAGATPEARTRAAAAVLTPQQVDAGVGVLIGAAADPEPTVRATAIRMLGTIGADRSLMPIVARLTDSARVVRALAAEGLLYMGVTELTGPAGDALARAQAEYVDALSSFPDAADNHVSLAWFASARGEHDAALREAAVAVDTSPAYPRAYVFKGLISARAGRFDEALAAFRTAKTLEPGFPNVDRMIEEAEKRLKVSGFWFLVSGFWFLVGCWLGS